MQMQKNALTNFGCKIVWIEMERIGYNKNDIKMFYEIKKTYRSCGRYCNWEYRKHGKNRSG